MYYGSSYACLRKKLIKGVNITRIKQLETTCDKYFGPDCRFCESDKQCLVCTKNCLSGEFLDAKNCTCSNCKISNCDKCNNDSCAKCNSGYYLEDNICKICPIGYICDSQNKTLCPAGTYQNEEGKNQCKSCPEGQYQDETGKENCKLCSEKFANCSICNANECLECNEGMELANGQCREEWCKGANFMKIENLCFTRRNMGDSAILTIPDSIKKIEVNESLAYIPQAELQDDEICYTGEKCCFWGETSRNKTGNVGRCDSITNGSYSGCNRTVCNHFAAQEICSSFKYKNKNWRLPKESEVLNLINYSSQLKDDGLMLCSYTDAKVTNQTTCPAVYNCSMQPISELNMYGGTNFCRASNICLDSSYKQGALYFTDAYNATDNKIERNPSYHGFSVRCVTEI